MGIFILRGSVTSEAYRNPRTLFGAQRTTPAPWSLPVAWAPPSLRPAAPAPLSGPSWQLREHQQVHLSQNGCLPISRPMGAFHIGHAACCRVGVTSTGASTGTESWWLVPRRRPDISAQVRSCMRLSMPRIACHRWWHSSFRFRLAP